MLAWPATRLVTIRRVLIAMAIGSLVDIGIVWNLATWVDPPSQMRSVYSRVRADEWINHWHSDIAVGRGRTRVHSEVEFTSKPEDWKWYAPKSHGTPPPRWAAKEVESFVRESLVAGRSGVRAQWIDDAIGWPMRSWQMRTGIPKPVRGTVSPLLVARTDTGITILVGAIKDRRMPVTPIWPGAVMNWVLYAFVAFVFQCLVLAVVERRRVRQGFCRYCRYDLSGIDADVCPECGKPLSPKV